MDDVLAQRSAVAAGFAAWDDVEPLTGGKGGIARAWAGGRAHVVKAYDAVRGDRGARERAALGALGGAGGVPALLAESDDPPFVVMGHVDGSTTLADLLLAPDEQAATAGLLGWAESLSGLHDAGTVERRSAFVDRLRTHAPDLPARTLAADFAVAAQRYDEALPGLGLSPHRQALEDLRALPARVGDQDDEVLSPADTCPDNAIVTAHGVRLVDLEHAELRHPAWDVAYLQAPWPSCWCAWRLPVDVAEAAVARYLATTTRAVPEAGARAGVDLATLGWQVMTPAWFLAGALASDDAGAGPSRPSRRAFVLHRLAAARADAEPAIAALARDLHGRLLDDWGEVALDLAPAFRRGPAGRGTCGGRRSGPLTPCESWPPSPTSSRRTTTSCAPTPRRPARCRSSGTGRCASSPSRARGGS